MAVDNQFLDSILSGDLAGSLQPADSTGSRSYLKQSGLKDIVALSPEGRAADRATNENQAVKNELLKEIGRAKDPAARAALEQELKRQGGDPSASLTADPVAQAIKPAATFQPPKMSAREDSTRFKDYALDNNPAFGGTAAKTDSNSFSVSKEIGAAIDSYQANLWAIPAAMGSEYALQAMLDNKAAAEKGWQDSGAPQSFDEMEFGKNFGQYFAHMALQSSPYMLEFMATGFGVGSAAKAALSNTAKGIAEKAAMEAAKLGATKAAAQKAGEAAAASYMGKVYTASGIAGSYPSAVGDVLSNQHEQAGKFDLPTAAALGVPYAALNAAGAEGMAVRAVARGLPKSAIAKEGVAGFAGRAALTGAEAGIMGGSTETGQEVMNQLGRMAVDPDAKIDDHRALEAYKDSFIAGTLLGGVPGAAAGGFRKPEDANLKPAAQKPNSPLTNAAKTAQPKDALMDALAPITAKFASPDFLNTVRGNEHIFGTGVAGALDLYRAAINPSLYPAKRIEAIGKLTRIIDMIGSLPGRAAQSNLNQQALLADEEGSEYVGDDGVQQQYANQAELQQLITEEKQRQQAAIKDQWLDQHIARATQGPTPGFGNMVEYENFLREQLDQLSQLRAEAKVTNDQKKAQEAQQKERELADIAKRVEDSRSQESSNKRDDLLSRVLASNPQNPNRAFDRALRLEGFRDSTFTEAEKAKIARFGELRQMQEEGSVGTPNEGGDFGIKAKPEQAATQANQNVANMLNAGWQLQGKQLVSPKGEKYNLKAGEAQFVRNKLNQKAGNGSQSPRGGSQGGTDQGNFGVGGAGANGPVPQGGGNGSGQANAIPNTGATAGTIQSSEAVGNGGQSNNPLARSRLTALDDTRIAKYADDLRSMAPDSGWQGGLFSSNRDTAPKAGSAAASPAGVKAPNVGDFIEGPNGYRIRVNEHKAGSNLIDPTADAGALTYEVRKGNDDANPLTMVLNKDGKLVDKKQVMNADGSSNGTAFVPPGAVSRGQLIELLRARAKTDVGSSERAAIDQKIKEIVTGYTKKSEPAQSSNFDVSNRTDTQLNYLTQHGQPGWKEAAVAELQKRGVQVSTPQQAKTDTLGEDKPVKRNALGLPEGYTFATGKDSREKVSASALQHGDVIHVDGRIIGVDKVTPRGDGTVDLLLDSVGGKSTYNVSADRQIERRKIVKLEQPAQVAENVPGTAQAPNVTEPAEKQRYAVGHNNTVIAVEPIHDVTYPEMPGRVFYTRQTEQGLFNVVDAKSGQAVFLGAASEDVAISNFPVRMQELGLDRVKERLESLPDIQAPKQEAAQQQEETDFEHAGYKIYRSRVNVAGEVKDYWAVQTKENRQKGKVGFGDTLHETKEQAIKAAERQQKDVEATAKYEADEQAKRDAEAKAKAEKEADTYNGFLDGKTPAKKGLIRKALAKEWRLNGVVVNVRDYIESGLANGDLRVSTYEENKIKPMSRTAFNRATQREQDAHEKKVREGGKVTVYEVNGFDLGKTAYDYAQHLLTKAKAETPAVNAVSQQKTDSAKKGQEQAAPVSQPENDKPAYADDAELQDALSHLGDVLGDVFGAKLNITGKQYGASDLLPAMSKVIELLIKKGFKSFRESVGAATNAMRGNANTKGFVDQITPRQWKAAYNSVAEFHEGTDSEEDVAKYSAEQIQKIIALPEKIKEAEQATNHDATPGQKEAGNYAKGKFAWKGMTISIETPKGAERSGTDESGQRWSITAPTSYGYFLSTTAADKEHLDVYIGDKPESDRVYVINQTKVDSLKLDEHKILIGFDSEEDAKNAYFGAFSEGFAPRVFGSIAGPFSVDEFKAMLPKLEKARFIEDRVTDKSERLVQEEKRKYEEAAAKAKAKEEERNRPKLDQITVTRSATLDGKEIEYDQKADEALNEIDGQMTLAKRLLECLAA